MPSIFTLEGAKRGRSGGRNCKTVHNKRTGCSIQLCQVGKSKKHKSGWKFMKGSSVCKK